MLNDKKYESLHSAVLEVVTGSVDKTKTIAEAKTQPMIRTIVRKDIAQLEKDINDKIDTLKKSGAKNNEILKAKRDLSLKINELRNSAVYDYDNKRESILKHFNFK